MRTSWPQRGGGEDLNIVAVEGEAFMDAVVEGEELK